MCSCGRLRTADLLRLGVDPMFYDTTTACFFGIDDRTRGAVRRQAVCSAAPAGS